MTVAPRGFQFRQFNVDHDQCAMKVGTDGILLGAWSNVSAARRILDVGTGCGLVALMLAQRNSRAAIDALESETAAARQAVENVAASPWHDRVTVYQGLLESFVPRVMGDKGLYDLLVCNPPFFCDGTGAADARRHMARNSAILSADRLVAAAGALLAREGRICLIIPANQASACRKNGERHGLQLVRQMLVRAKPDRRPNRALLELARHQEPWRIPMEQLVIYTRNDVYSHQYWSLTREFYLDTTTRRPDRRSAPESQD